MFRLLCFLGVLFFSNIICYGQLSRIQIKRNNQRLMTYKGDIRNKYGLNKRYAYFGLRINALNYYGDLSPTPKKISTDISFTKPGLGLTLGFRISPRTFISGEFLYGTLTGEDNESAKKNDLKNGVFRYNRNLSFRNRIKEFAILAAIDLYKNDSFYSDRVNVTPYVFFGIAILHHNPQAKVPQTDLQGNTFANAGQWVNLRELGTEGQNTQLLKTESNYGNTPYKLIQPAIPFGIGIRFKLNDQLDFSTDFSIRYLFTDYIDDVSKNYVDLGALGNNELAKAMSYRTNEVMQPNYSYTSERDGKTYSVLSGYGHEHKDNLRGNRNNNDVYTILSFHLSYILKNLPGKDPKYR